MKFLKCITTCYLIIFGASSLFGQPVHRNIKTLEYKQLQKRLCKGWNTWYTNSLMSYVHLPEGFSFNLCLTNTGSDYLKDIYKASKSLKRPEEVNLGLRSDDGSYTSLVLKFKDAELEVQSTVMGDNQYILVTPLKETKEILVVEAGLLWNLKGTIGAYGDSLVGKIGNNSYVIKTTEPTITNSYALSTAPRICLSLKEDVAIYTGREVSLDHIKKIVSNARESQISRLKQFGDMAEVIKPIQTVLAWNTIYDAPNKRAITPVSRLWARNWNGWVLFDWDTYFASLMFSAFNKDLAYANAIEITKAITPFGFIPNFAAPFGLYSWDRSQPPVGSRVIWELYKKFNDRWLLEEVYDELATWNRWWPEHRDKNGFLAWGSDNPHDSLFCGAKHNMQAAMYESGLDNSPMYDQVPFNKETNMMELADVGLMSIYIMDCRCMAEIAAVLGKKEDAEEFNNRAVKYTKKLKELWDEEIGIYLNRRLDTGEKNYRISPTNFYPMLAKACTQKQAERMIKEHYFNPDEFHGEFVIPSIARNDPAFKDNEYWRGRIWAPMNFLVYLGMINYDLPEARADLAEKSKTLLMKSWNQNGAIYENYNAVTGQGDDVKNSDSFYHWGALLNYIMYMENDIPNSSVDITK